MEITWFGHSCFRLKGNEAAVVTDPASPETGYAPGRLMAEIVTVSHRHAGHNNTSNVSGVRKVLWGPGEYDLSNVLVTGIAAFHDDERGARLGRNTVFLIELDGVRVCHLGDIGHVPQAEHLTELTNVDVLLIPVGGGGSTLGAAAAVKAINVIEPKLVVPMHYRAPGSARSDLDPLDRFLREMGLAPQEPQARLTVTRQALPKEKEAKVQVLEPQA